uniref:Uncharacterized protein n=1 Tax=Acrobeloides nanus TaxID=290746 RepID=A0A914E779_9BILA
MEEKQLTFKLVLMRSVIIYFLISCFFLSVLAELTKPAVGTFVFVKENREKRDDVDNILTDATIRMMQTDNALYGNPWYFGRKK